MIWFEAGDREQEAAALARRFVQTHRREPDGVWSAPGRITLIGEHVDYNDGRCLPIALPHRTFAALARREDDALDLVSAQITDGTGRFAADLKDVGPGSPPGWAAYPAGVAWALRENGLPVGGFDAVLDGRVPLGAGLSSSAAIECAVALALADLNGLAVERVSLAAACVRAENEVAGAPTGGMDQAASLRATAGHALLLDCRDFSAEQVPFDLAAAGLTLLVIDTRAHHALTDGQYGNRRSECAAACRRLGVGSLRELHDAGGTAEGLDPVLTRRVRHVLTELDRVDRTADLLATGVAGVEAELGRLLDASHASLRDDFEVSCAELDVAVGAARAAGALGARMTGGGFGGSAIALVPADTVEAVAQAVADAFAEAGFRSEPAFGTAEPGPGADRDL